MNVISARKALKAYLVFALLICLLCLSGRLFGIVFRQYLRIAGVSILAFGLIAVLSIMKREVPEENRRGKILLNAAIIILILMISTAAFLQIFLGTDRETVVIRDNVKKIEVERSWIMFLERSYYDYGNALWYRRYPHYTEYYDDGDPDQYLYTDIYDECGNFTERVEDQERK
ncbi:MAG: hypothetical protein IKD87_04390 [Oscillospiraceae bacterium]|nr:hypothetical protein [Oscillospiraceae bacterium]